MTWVCLCGGNMKRENESRLIAAQNNVTKINYVKVGILKIQMNSKCIPCKQTDRQTEGERRQIYTIPPPLQ